jgi:hypothetical protein
MAKLNFEFSNGTLTATGANTFVRTVATDYMARTIGDGGKIEVYPVSNDQRLPRFEFKSYTWVTIEGATSTSNADFVDDFNMKAGAKYAYNTKYCETILSGMLDPDTSEATQITALQKGGYVTFLADPDNTGLIFIGDSNVDNTSFALDSGKSVFMEIDDLSKIWIYASTPGDIVSYLGAYKD